MKKIERLIVPLFCFITFVFISDRSWAQDYKPFIETNKYWDVALPDPNDVSCNLYYYRYFFHGDTIINSLTYSKLALSGTICNNGPFEFSRDTFHLNNRFYREDFASQRVYRFDISEQEEQLLYEFDKEVGDTISYVRCSTIEQAEVQSIDIIIDRDGISRRAYIYKDISSNDEVEGFDNYSLIEGVGSGGPFDGVCPGTNVERIICSFYNEPPEDQICYDFITSTSNFNDYQIKIYPNPVVDKLSLRDAGRDIYIKIYNSIGLLINSKFINQNYDIDLSKYPVGVYIMQILDSKGRLVMTKKIMKV